MHDQAYPKHPKQQLYNIFAISQGTRKGWSSFFPADNCQTFLQSYAVIFFMCVARHAQITQNKKFAISLQYLKKEVNDKVDFLHAGKHQSGLQVDFNTLGTKIGDKEILIRITDKHDEAFSNCSK